MLKNKDPLKEDFKVGDRVITVGTSLEGSLEENLVNVTGVIEKVEERYLEVKLNIKYPPFTYTFRRSDNIFMGFPNIKIVRDKTVHNIKEPNNRFKVGDKVITTDDFQFKYCLKNSPKRIGEVIRSDYVAGKSSVAVKFPDAEYPYLFKDRQLKYIKLSPTENIFKTGFERLEVGNYVVITKDFNDSLKRSSLYNITYPIGTVGKIVSINHHKVELKIQGADTNYSFYGLNYLDYLKPASQIEIREFNDLDRIEQQFERVGNMLGLDNKTVEISKPKEEVKEMSKVTNIGKFPKFLIHQSVIFTAFWVMSIALIVELGIIISPFIAAYCIFIIISVTRFLNKLN